MSAKNLASSQHHGNPNASVDGNEQQLARAGTIGSHLDDEHFTSQPHMRSLRSMSSRASFILETHGGDQAETQDEDEEIVDEMIRSGAPVPPDGGYGWVIVFVSFVANFALDGITCTFGVLLPSIAKEFDVGKGQVAWAGSLLCGGQLLLGPIVSALTNKFGCRIVCVCGGLICSLGFFLSSFAPNLIALILSYGIVGAIGFALVYLPNIVSVGYYFEKRRAMATGIAVCGAGFGATSFAPLASLLTQYTTWRTINRMFAGLLFICGACGLLIRPLEVQCQAEDDFGEQEDDPEADPKRRPLLYRMAEDKKHLFERNSIGGSEYFMVKLPDGKMERRLKMPVNVDPGVHSTFNLDQFTPHTVPPLTPIQLTPITESERKQAADSSRDSGLGSHPNRTLPGEATEESSVGGIDIPISDSNRSKVLNEEAGVHSYQSKQDEVEFSGAQGVRSPYKFTRKMSMHETENGSGRHASMQPYGSFGGSSIHTDISHTPGRKYSIRAVPAPVFSRSFSRRDSFSSQASGKRVGDIGSVEDNSHSLLRKDPTHTSLTHKNSVEGSTPGSVRRIIRPLSRKDIFYSGSIKNLAEFSAPNYRQSILNIPQQANEAPDGKPQICPGVRSKATNILRAMRNFLDFSLIKNPVFLCLALSGVVGMLGFFVPFVYVIDFCAERGIDSSQASILISIVGVMNTVGRVGFGMLSDMPQVNSLYLYNFCLLAMGIATACEPLCYNLESFIAVYIVFGLFLSGFISLTSITLVDLLGLENLTNSFGLLMFFRGIASIVGSPFAGFLYDSTKSYEIPFYVAGTFLILSSIIASLIPFISKFAPPKPELKQKEALGPSHLPDIPEAREPDEEERSSHASRGKEAKEEQQLFALEDDTIPPIAPIAPAPSAPSVLSAPPML